MHYSHNLFRYRRHGVAGESANVVTHEYRNGVKGPGAGETSVKLPVFLSKSFDDYVELLHDKRYQQALT